MRVNFRYFDIFVLLSRVMVLLFIRSLVYLYIEWNVNLKVISPLNIYVRFVVSVI